MTSRGSVLIVVLGLLAILAVVGITFVTMSNIDSSTAANFALQAQFDLAADGAIDYVCHALVQDVWEFDSTSGTSATTYRMYTGRLLTGLLGTEPYDFPDSAAPTANTPDAWLATNWVGSAPPTGATYSFKTASTVTLYNLSNFGGSTVTSGSGDLDGHPNNLGIPFSGSQVKWNNPANGLWIPDLAFPYEYGVIRTSVTVQDHCALVNLNAHGNADSSKWTYRSGRGYGGFLSDVSPIFTGLNIDIARLVGGDGTTPGRWSEASGPCIQATGETLIQNPAAYSARPYTLDEEFELRRLTGTYATTRLEYFAGAGLTRSPSSGTQTAWENRLNLTTQGWTAQVRPHPLDATTPTNIVVGGHVGNRKRDINLEDEAVLVTTLQEARAFSTTTEAFKQFMANFVAFRGRVTGTPFYKTSTLGKTGAHRQIIMTKVKVAKTTVGNPNDTWQVRVQVYNPWRGDYAGDADGSIDTTGHGIDATFSGSQTVPVSTTVGTANTVANRSTWETTLKSISVKTGSTFESVVLKRSSHPTLDQCTVALGDLTGTGGYCQRPVSVYDQKRGDESDEDSVTVLYVKKWQTGTEGNWSSLAGHPTVAAGDGIPIRFPQCVKLDYDPKTKGPLPPWGKDKDNNTNFKAFLRVGDLNQVLCPKDDTDAANFWPWVDRISRITVDAAKEANIKFNWKDTTAPWDISTQFCRMNAADVLCVGGPWADMADNDGDGTQDETPAAAGKIADIGAEGESKGRFCGPELRVAGRINLNTATDKTLEAIDTGLQSGGAIKDAVKNLRGASNTTPIKSIAQLVNQVSAAPGPTQSDAKGPLELRDLYFTRVSNIASVRSDTFSIYGTVQHVEPPATAGATPRRIMKTRRFWALVDRSPTLAFSPTKNDTAGAYSHPRVMNFQWID